MDDEFYDYRFRVAIVGTANVAQIVAFIAEHERSTHIKYFVIDDMLQIDTLRGLDVVFMLTALTDAATCKTAHLIADCVKNENLFLSVAIVQSASNEFSDELNYLEENLDVVINFEEQQNNYPVEDFSYKIVHPLIKNRLQSARSVFLNVIGSHDSLLMMEVNEATTLVYDSMNPDGEYYSVVNLDETLGDKIFVMIIVRV